MEELNYKQDLFSWNRQYMRKHGNLIDRDIIKVLKLKEAIEDKKDSRDQPAIGDIVICNGFNTYHNKPVVYDNGHIETINKAMQCHICTEPYTPQVSPLECKSHGKGFFFSTSGGYWFVRDISKLEPAPEKFRCKTFWTWGSWGRCADGGVYFKADVRVWAFTDNNVIY